MSAIHPHLNQKRMLAGSTVDLLAARRDGPVVRLVDPYGREMPTTRERAVAEQRAKFRAKLRAAYDAAQTTSENAKHWRWADTLSASEANSLEVRQTLRSRARYECLEANSFAKGIVCTLANDFISTGPGLQMQLEDRADLARRIERKWKRWARQVRLVKKLRTARLAKCVDGEAWILASTNPRIRGPVKLDLRLIESDQMSSPGWIDGRLSNEVDGIKFDRWGNVRLYQMLHYHPGDRRATVTHEAVELSPEHVIHLFNADRPGQVRGVPEVTTSLPLFAFLRRYTLASVLAAETAADFAAILKTQANAFADVDATPQDPFESVDIDRGMMTALPYGYDMEQFKAEHPTTTYTEFRNALLQEIARPIHMPTNKARGDSSGYNYSSARLDHQIYYHAIDVERCDWEVECLDRIFEWWLVESMLAEPREFPGMSVDLLLSGELDLPHTWHWKPAVSVNPLQDAQTAVILRDAELMTERDYLTQQGIDPETHWDQIDAERDRRTQRRAPSDEMREEPGESREPSDEPDDEPDDERDNDSGDGEAPDDENNATQE